MADVVRIPTYYETPPHGNDDRSSPDIAHRCVCIHVPSNTEKHHAKLRTRKTNVYLDQMRADRLVQRLARDGLIQGRTTAPMTLLRCMAKVVYNE